MRQTFVAISFLYKVILKKNNCGGLAAHRMDIGSKYFNPFFFLHYVLNKHNIYSKFIVYLFHKFFFYEKKYRFQGIENNGISLCEGLQPL